MENTQIKRKQILFGALAAVAAFAVMVGFLWFQSKYPNNVTQGSGDNFAYWVAPDNGWVIVGAIYLNGEPVFSSQDLTGDLTLLQKGDEVRAPWGMGKKNLRDEDLRAILRDELDFGCAIQFGGCDKVVIHISKGKSAIFASYEYKTVEEFDVNPPIIN